MFDYKQLSFLLGTQTRARTGMDCSTGVWDQRVYRFRHLGLCKMDYDNIIVAQIANAKVDNFRDTDKLLVYFFTSRPIVS